MSPQLADALRPQHKTFPKQISNLSRNELCALLIEERQKVRALHDQLSGPSAHRLSLRQRWAFRRDLKLNQRHAFLLWIEAKKRSCLVTRSDEADKWENLVWQVDQQTSSVERVLADVNENIISDIEEKFSQTKHVLCCGGWIAACSSIMAYDVYILSGSKTNALGAFAASAVVAGGVAFPHKAASVILGTVMFPADVVKATFGGVQACYAKDRMRHAACATAMAFRISAATMIASRLRVPNKPPEPVVAPLYPNGFPAI